MEWSYRVLSGMSEWLSSRRQILSSLIEKHFDRCRCEILHSATHKVAVTGCRSRPLVPVKSAELHVNEGFHEKSLLQRSAHHTRAPLVFAPQHEAN